VRLVRIVIGDNRLIFGIGLVVRAWCLSWL
jgi:hypothetical protein